MSATLGKNPLLAFCKACEHVWPYIWYPCKLTLFAEHKNPGCPVCGAKGEQVVIASKDAGHLDLYVKFLEQEIDRARKEAA